jgi:hypothetical protein
MQPDKRHIHLWERGDHPSVELLEQYHGGTLPEALHHQLERHLLDCDQCSDVLEGLAVSDATQTESDVRDINRRITAKSRRNERKPLPLYLTDWKVAAALALMLLSTVVVFYYNYQQVSERQGIAAQQEQAIQEAMTQREEWAPAAPATVADAKPDTVRPGAIAAVTKPRALPTPRTRTSPAVREAGAIQADALEEVEVEIDVADLTESMPEKVIPAQPAKLAEVTAPPPPLHNTLLPESTPVAKALQGRVAGVQVQRSKELGHNQVQGQVVDEDGTPLPGVSIVVKGTTQGVATDAQGNFVLTLPDDKATLVFRYIGYQTREKIIAANSSPITMDLQVDNRALSEVVVTGYSTSTSRPAPIVAAKPASGNSAYRKYLAENLRYTPDMPKGRVVIRATVTTSGWLENLEVVRGLCEPCDDEALRLVAQGPKWQPATQDGHKIEKTVRIVVRFRPEKTD